MKVNKNRVFVVAENPGTMPDLMFDWSAVIAGGLTAGAAALQASTYHPRKDFRHAKELAEYNSTLNEAMYNKYGSPEAMMRQYKEAGLNPALMYGNVSPSVPEAGQVDSSMAKGLSGGFENRLSQALQGLANGITLYQSIVSQQQALTNAKKQADYIAANTALVNARAEAQNFKNSKQEDIYNLDKALKSTRLQSNALQLMVDQKFKFQKEEAGLKSAIADLEHKKNRNQQDDVQLNLLKEKLGYVVDQRQYLQKRIEFTDFSMKMQEKKYDLNLAQFAEQQYMNQHKILNDSRNYGLNSAKFNWQRGKDAYEAGMRDYQFDTKMKFMNKQANRAFGLGIAKLVAQVVGNKQKNLSTAIGLASKFIK